MKNKTKVTLLSSGLQEDLSKNDGRGRPGFGTSSIGVLQGTLEDVTKETRKKERQGRRQEDMVGGGGNKIYYYGMYVDRQIE